MKVRFIPVLFLFAFFLAAGCQKDKNVTPTTPEADKPDIETIDATPYPDGGVLLKGKINRIPRALKQVGFIIAADSLFHTGASTVFLKDLPPVGEYTANLNAGIDKNRKYYYAAFQVDSSQQYKLYNTKSFVATGGKQIKFTSISPLKADIWDTLTVKGKFFTGQPISIKFDQQAGYVIPVSDSVIKVVVSSYITNAKPLVTLQNNEQTITLTDQFSLFAPIVTSFTNTGTFRDAVVIKGDHFRIEPGATEVTFGNIKAVITSATKKQLLLTVPDDLEHSASKITVTAQYQSTVGTGVFQITKPQITNVTSTGKVGDAVVVEGRYFHPEGYRNTVFYENTAASFVSGNTIKLTTELPNGGYPRRKATIKVKLLDDIVTYNLDLPITDKWVVVNNNMPFPRGYTVGAFTVNNVSYVVAGVDDTNPTKYLWRFNKADFSWQRISMPFDFETGLVTSVGNKAYLFANAGNTSSFWEYDVAANTWSKKANFTNGVRYAGTIFPIGGKVYLGLGSSYNNEPDNSFYEYNISQNSWKKIADYPTDFSDGVRINASSFVLNNTAYVGGGASNTGMYSYYSYMPANNAWVKIADFPDARSNAIPFVINGYGFVAGGIPVGASTYRDCYKYDPNSNTWTKMKDTVGVWPLGSDGIDYGFSFVNSGDVYIGCRGNDTYNFQLYQAFGNDMR